LLANRPLLIRTQGNAAQVIGAVDRVIASIDPHVVATASTLEDGLRRSPPFVMSSLAATVSSGIGLLGLLLAIVGIFGTVSHIVSLRTREVGIRIAIGAQSRHILWLILGESSRPVAFGLTAGMTLAVGIVYILRGILYGI